MDNYQDLNPVIFVTEGYCSNGILLRPLLRRHKKQHKDGVSLVE
jgi:hypothetical protein